MKKENIIKVKSYAFALKTLNVCRNLQNTEKEYILT